MASAKQIHTLADANGEKVIWTAAAELLVLLLRVAIFYIRRHRNGLASILQRGYILVSDEFLVGHAAEFLRGDAQFVETYAPHLAVKDGRDLLNQLIALPAPSAWPLRAGPVLRHDAELFCVDLASATYQLEARLQYPSETGSVANVRSLHFEDAVQRVIDESEWRPIEALRTTRQRPMRRNGNVITDIDAIGEHNGTILLVSCKSVIYSDLYDVGDHRSVRNCASLVKEAVADWSSKVLTLGDAPGDNFDFTGRKIVGVVCTPQVVYVDLGNATTEVAPGLRACSTVAELQIWLKAN